MARVKYDDVPLVVQRGPNCWMACAAMVLSWKNKRSYGLSDIKVLYDPAKSSFSWAVETDQLKGLGFWTAVPNKDEVDQGFIATFLKAHGPFILRHNPAFIRYHSPFGLAPPGSMHSIVITGTDPHGFNGGDKQSAGDEGRCWFNNPWGTRNGSCHTSDVITAIKAASDKGLDSIAAL